MNETSKLLVLVLAALCALTPGAHVVAQPLVLGVPLEPPNLDPTSGAAAAVDEVVYGNIFEGLTRITQSGAVAPALAESWETSPDGLSHVFHLRRGVRFHDGSDFAAGDVKFTLDRMLAPESTNAQKQLLAPVDSVDILDSHTIRITTQQPMSTLPYVLGWGDAVVVAPESAADNASQPVGTGPFRFSDWRRGDSITLQRNPDYWGPMARMESVVFKFIGDPAAAFASMKAGDIDAYPNYPAPENVAEFASDPQFKVVVGASEGKVIMAVNNARAPFDNQLVRAAMSHAVNREDVINGASFGFGEPIGSHYTRQSPSYVDLIGRYPYDVEKARLLLAEAGYPDGFSATLRLPPRPYARRAGEVIAAQLAEIGIQLTIENLEWAQWLDQVFQRREFDLTVVEHIEPMDFGIYAREDYYFGYASDEYRELVADLDVAVDPVRRGQLLERIQTKLSDDAVNVFLYQSARIGVWKSALSGLWADTPIAANVAASAWIEGAESGIEERRSVASAAGLWFKLVLFALLLLLVIFVVHNVGAGYLLGRLGAHLGTLVAASIVVFVIIQVVPGDPAAYMMGMNASPDSIEALRHQMGLDAPALERYFDWVGGLATGHFGTSYTYLTPVGTLIAERLMVSGPLALLAMVLSLIIAIPVGVIAVSKRGTAIDTGLGAVMQIGIALPNFWIAMLLIMVFATQLQWFSAGGFVGWDAGVLPALKGLLLPAIALAAPQAAIIARVLRSSLLETMNEDYIRTARAKGLSVGQSLWRHALRNAFIPVLTIIGLQLPFLLAGGIIIENVFSLPGLGRLVFQAITQRDLIVVQSVVIVLVFAVVSVTFLIDLAYTVVDPRLRSSAK